MKIYNNIHHGAIHFPSLPHTVEVIRHGLGQSASKLFKGIANFVTQIQIARMQSAFYRMTDEQRAKINLKRSDIQQRAEFLITGKTQNGTFKEYDGL